MTNFAAMLQPQVRDLGRDQEVPCRDPECADQGGVGEPEQDGEHRYMSCNLCGMDFNFVKLETSVIAEDADGNCQVGIPAEVRRAASAMGSPDSHAGHDHAPPAKPQPVSIGLTIGLRPSD